MNKRLESYDIRIVFFTEKSVDQVDKFWHQGVGKGSFHVYRGAIRKEPVLILSNNQLTQEEAEEIINENANYSLTQDEAWKNRA